MKWESFVRSLNKPYPRGRCGRRGRAVERARAGAVACKGAFRGRKEGGRERALQVATRVIMKRSKHSPLSAPPSVISGDGLLPLSLPLPPDRGPFALALLHFTRRVGPAGGTGIHDESPRLELCTIMTY